MILILKDKDENHPYLAEMRIIRISIRIAGRCECGSSVLPSAPGKLA